MKPKTLRRGITQNEYSAIHIHLNYQFNKSGACQMCLSKNVNRTEWALIKGRDYSRDIKDYMELCVPCHRKYDVTDEFREKTANRMRSKFKSGEYKSRLPDMTGLTGGGHPSAKKIVQTDKNTGEVIKEWDSITDASKQLNILCGCISNCISGRQKTAGGFIWNLKNKS